MEFKEEDIFAAFSSESYLILGRVMNISDSGLEIKTTFDDDIHLASFHQLDVFSKDHIYLREVPVKILSDDKIMDDQSQDKIIVRNLKFSFL